MMYLSVTRFGRITTSLGTYSWLSPLTRVVYLQYFVLWTAFGSSMFANAT